MNLLVGLLRLFRRMPDRARVLCLVGMGSLIYLWGQYHLVPQPFSSIWVALICLVPIGLAVGMVASVKAGPTRPTNGPGDG